MRFGGVSILVLSAPWLAHAQTPVINSGGIVNAASYDTSAIAPGSIVSIFGSNLATQNAGAAVLPLPTTLANITSVTFNGIPAPLYFVAKNQINVQVPWGVLPAGTALGAANVIVTTSAGSSVPQMVQLASSDPGIFAAAATGLGQAVATDNADGAIAAPAGSITNATSHPIQVGDYLVLWCTGLGDVDQPVPNGAAPSQTARTLISPTVLIGGVAGIPVYSVLSPQYPGEYQVAVQVAPGTPPGNAVPLQIQMNGALTPATVTIAVSSSTRLGLPSEDCTRTSTVCTQINLGVVDPFSASGGFGGYADATIRQDPLTGTLWMAYSWPHTIPSGKPGVAGTQVIDTHVAFSVDSGRTWAYKGPLYTSQPVSNPVTGATDYTAHEVMNLLPQVVNGVTYWYGIHSTYTVAAGAAGPSQAYTKRWEIAMALGTAANGPMGLANATPQFLGQNVNTYPQYFPVSMNLSSLHPELSGCSQFYEPALVTSGNNLYLFLDCWPADDSPANKFYAVFTTSSPQTNAPDWIWSYIPEGATKFGNESDAASVGRYLAPGTNYITQMDIAPSAQSGNLLAIITGAYDNSSGKNSLGCVAVELAGLNPPKFIYNAQGQVQVDAFLTSSDSQMGGPGSCTYSPVSGAGMILAHRQSANAPQNGGFFTFLMQSGLFP